MAKNTTSVEETSLLSEIARPLALTSNYNYIVHYAYPGPLSCLAGVDSGCSDVVDAGPEVGGLGRFCDYAVMCGGGLQTILYNRFEPTA